MDQSITRELFFYPLAPERSVSQRTHNPKIFVAEGKNIRNLIPESESNAGVPHDASRLLTKGFVNEPG